MVNSVKIPWGAWNGEDETINLEFPNSWDITLFDMADAKDITNTDAIKTALRNPIGTQTIQEIAHGKESVVIVVEDISRPTKCGPICEVVLEELNSAGIPDHNITLIGAVGSHRPMTRDDYIAKVGTNVVTRINIENHHPYENLVELGKSSMGTPIYLNKTYFNADIKIAVGTVIPHPLAGFGGGAKIVLPGICGIETLAANHKAGLEGKGIGLGIITELRKDIEEVCRRVGLDFSINTISTKNRGIAGVFAGHFIDAHRKAIELAKQVYQTKIPSIKDEDKYDVGFFNLFPEDTELKQTSKGLNMFMRAGSILKDEAAVVFLSACSEGRGFHSLLGETGGKLFEKWKELARSLLQLLQTKKFALFSPNLSRADVTHYWSENMVFLDTFNALVEFIETEISSKPKVCVFPTSIQLSS